MEIEAIAVVAEPGVELEIERFAPSNGFSGAVAVTAHGVKTVYVAGQIAGGDSLAAQTAAVWERVAQRLDAAGASLADLVKATTYIVDFDPETDLPAYRTGREQALALDDMPASTLLGNPGAGRGAVPDRDRRHRGGGRGRQRRRTRVHRFRRPGSRRR